MPYYMARMKTTQLKTSIRNSFRKKKRRKIYFRRYFTVLVAFLYTLHEKGSLIYIYIFLSLLLVFIEFFLASVKCFVSKGEMEDRAGSYRSRIRFWVRSSFILLVFFDFFFVPQSDISPCRIMGTRWVFLIFLTKIVFKCTHLFPPISFRNYFYGNYNSYIKLYSLI